MKAALKFAVDFVSSVDSTACTNGGFKVGADVGTIEGRRVAGTTLMVEVSTPEIDDARLVSCAIFVAMLSARFVAIVLEKSAAEDEVVLLNSVTTVKVVAIV